MKLFHASVEGAQHGAKGFDGFLKFASYAGAAGCQPSNFMLEDGKGGFLPPAYIKRKFAERGLMFDGISAHCPFWVHTTAWTGSKTMKSFLPASLTAASVEKIEDWAKDYIFRLLDLCADLGVKVVPMFWGTAWGWEVATGYPWGFWKGPGYDLIAEGDDRFVNLTEVVRNRANSFGIVLAHEIHPGTGAMCASDFLHIVKICDGDGCLGVNKDDSHCWEGESWQTRFDLVADRVYGCHMKNHYVRPGHPLRSMIPDWSSRPMQFTALDRGDIDLLRSTEQLIRIGYSRRYCILTSAKTAPLVVEAEGAYENLDAISARGIKWVRDNCCFNVAEGSFEDGMGADK
ncbi:MAG: Xylose isomerase domain protein TIM barrel [Parcubacteria group bacterium Licking1014_1]|nr:MAG: Xylose isomerase domain protein TIM barrel [Parcubacteria group bacterium Licking1014_1]